MLAPAPRSDHTALQMTRSVAVVALLLGACGGAEAPEVPEAPAAEAGPVECRTVPSALASYDAIADGVAFSLEIRRDERGAWLPRAPLAMPMHHASMISWTDEQHLLDAHTSREPVLVFATGLGRLSMEHDEERNVFFATYGARVDRVCPAPTD